LAGAFFLAGGFLRAGAGFFPLPLAAAPFLPLGEASSSLSSSSLSSSSSESKSASEMYMSSSSSSSSSSLLGAFLLGWW